MSDSLQPHELYPRNSPGQNTGVGSLSLLQDWNLVVKVRIGPDMSQLAVKHLACRRSLGELGDLPELG